MEEKDKSDMKRAILSITMLSAIGTAVCFCIYKASGNEAMLTAAIAFGTTAYHFFMRLGVGVAFHMAMNNRADYTKKWYQCRAWEKKLYERLNVKRWKNAMPTYETNAFDHTRRSWDEIAQASCQAELVHETIVLLSFVPIIFSIWFDSIMVFIITSVFAALFDMIFVIMQRYNRPRIIRLIHR